MSNPGGRFLALHFGPGQLGLGLIVDILQTSDNYDVYVVGNPKSQYKELPRFKIAFLDSSRSIRSHEVVWAGNPASYDQLPKELLSRLESSEPVLVTAALGERNVEEGCQRIADFLRGRGGAETAVLLCENGEPRHYDFLSGIPGVSIHHCVVDRICAWRDDDGSEPPKKILAHSVSEWVIPHATQSGGFEPGKSQPDRVKVPISGLSGSDFVVLLDGDEVAHRTRKTWVVNGNHLVLATMARRHGKDRLPLSVEDHFQFSKAVTPLMLVMLNTVERLHGLKVDESFAEDRVRAFAEAPDSASRILKDRYLRRDLRPFVERLDARLASAARRAREVDLDVTPFMGAFAVIVRAMDDERTYLDFLVRNEKTGNLEINHGVRSTSKIDSQVLDGFERCLDWAPDGWRTRRLDDIQKSLSRWPENS